ETDGEKILKNVSKINTANTRIFTFGVGDDVNATLLDQLAEQTRSVVTYVRETETIEAKAEGLFAKIANPVLANLKLQVMGDVSINEVYPPQLPDLFHGNQVVVLGRYHGKGHAAIKLTGQVGKDAQEYVYEINFPEKSVEDKAFVEDLWARRKVGYLLDQIRVNGESKEVVEEVVALAKRYGITTPYTSYLLVPDGPTPVARGAMPAGGAARLPDVSFHLNAPGAPPPGLAGPGGSQVPVTEFLKRNAGGGGKKGGAGGIDGAKARSEQNEKELAKVKDSDK